MDYGLWIVKMLPLPHRLPYSLAPLGDDLFGAGRFGVIGLRRTRAEFPAMPPGFGIYNTMGPGQTR